MADLQQNSFLKYCRQTATDAYLHSQGWSLDHFETSESSGPIIYLKDFDTGYTQLATLSCDIEKEEKLHESEFEEVVHTIDLLIKAQTHQLALEVEHQREKLAHLFSTYAINTQTAVQARRQFGSKFSLYIIGYTTSDGRYELRPFALSQPNIKTHVEVNRIFEMAWKKIKTRQVSDD